MAFSSFFNLTGGSVSNNEKTKEVRKNYVNIKLESESIINPIFKKIQSLKKILTKFSNKTYQMKEETNVEVLIKRQICEIFNYYLDLREDFFLTNVISYFQTCYIKKNKNPSSEDLKLIEEEILELFPENWLKIDQEIPNTYGYKKYTNKSPSYFFDLAINRHFIGVLLSSFYFSNDYKLQNSIMKLIFRCSSQKIILKKNVQKLEILFQQDYILLYKNLKIQMESLQKIMFNSQVFIIFKFIFLNFKLILKIKKIWIQLSNNLFYDNFLHVFIEKIEKLKNLFTKGNYDV